MSAYRLESEFALIGTDGRISGTWVALRDNRPGGVWVTPHNVVVYDENHHSGRVIYGNFGAVYVARGNVGKPRGLGRYPEVEDAWGEFAAAVLAVAEAFRERREL